MTRPKIVLIAALVTAAVTSVAPRCAQAGDYAPVMTNLNTGKTLTWRTRFPSQETCDAAVGELPSFVAWLGSPESTAENQPRPQPNTDPVIRDQVERLVINMWMNTGIVPNLSFSCEAQGDPA